MNPNHSTEACACGHILDDHTMVLVIITPMPAGAMTCPVGGCTCWSTWSATRTRSTPEERETVRRRVLAELRAARWPGYLPER